MGLSCPRAETARFLSSGGPAIFCQPMRTVPLLRHPACARVSTVVISWYASWALCTCLHPAHGVAGGRGGRGAQGF